MVYLLTDVPVLEEAFLRDVAFLELHAEFQVLLHDRFVYFLPCPMFSALDDIVKGIQGAMLFSNINELWKRPSRPNPNWLAVMINFEHHENKRGQWLTYATAPVVFFFTIAVYFPRELHEQVATQLLILPMTLYNAPLCYYTWSVQWRTAYEPRCVAGGGRAARFRKRPVCESRVRTDAAGDNIFLFHFGSHWRLGRTGTRATWHRKKKKSSASKRSKVKQGVGREGEENTGGM